MTTNEAKQARYAAARDAWTEGYLRAYREREASYKARLKEAHDPVQK